MKDGLRFVDCDMHVMEPADLFERYLDPKFRDRVTVNIDSTGKPNPDTTMAPPIIIDGQPSMSDLSLEMFRKRLTKKPEEGTHEIQPLSGSRIHGHLNFAIERNYDPEAQIMGMELEGIDIAVLFPTMGLYFIEIGRAHV